jgi:hypothetical protein
MIHPTFDAFTAFSSLTITKDRDVSSNYPAKIEALSVVFSAFRLIPAKVIDKFSAVYSVSARSRV